MGDTISLQSVQDHDDIPQIKEGQTIHAKARRRDRTEVKISLKNVGEIGVGAFGAVNKMLVKEEDTLRQPYNCAVKIPGSSGILAKIELYLLLKLQHENVVKLLYYFIPKGLTDNIVIVLELVEGGDLFHHMKHLSSSPSKGLGTLFEVFSYQLFRGLAYCHSRKVCHRDIKPENLLVDSISGVLKIADFGCGAEIRGPGETHTFYIGTRIFRAPELLLGSDSYEYKVDVWSAAIVMTEMILGVPVFYARAGLEALLGVMFEHMGLPTENDLADMHVGKVSFPAKTQKNTSVEARIHKCKPREEVKLIELLNSIIVYSPSKRLSAWEACASDFFDSLRGLKTLESGKAPPKFFDFTEQEIQSMPESIRKKLAGGI